MSASNVYCFKVFSRHLKGPSILELGPSEGLMTELLARTGNIITVLEGSKMFCDRLNKLLPEVHVFHDLFETFNPKTCFDTIILCHVLEHVIDLVSLLKKVKLWLSHGGRIFYAVPNAISIHRQAAVIMSLLDFEKSLNSSDLQHGHRRVFFRSN